MYENELKEYAEDILNSENFLMTKQHIQHGTMSVHDHCISVAKMCLKLNDKFHISKNRRELVRGALLHDYFLYDWHIGDYRKPYKLHGVFHPGRALRNAQKEYELTKREEDIIKKHMWPLTIVPPACREAWIVTVADKYCSILETLRLKNANKCESKSLAD